MSRRSGSVWRGCSRRHRSSCRSRVRAGRRRLRTPRSRRSCRSLRTSWPDWTLRGRSADDRTQRGPARRTAASPSRAVALSPRRRTPGPSAAGRHGSFVWLNLAVVYVVWGSTYLAIRVAGRTIPPFLSAGSRFFVATLLVGGFLAATRGLSSLRVTRRELLGCAFVGGMLLLGGNGLVVLAEEHIASGLAALVVA